MKFSKGYLTLLIVTSCITQAASQDTIAYNLEGKGKQTLFFIHGWCIDQSYWKSQVDEFKKEYQVLTVDLAGHGKSIRIRHDWSIKSFANDIVQLIKKLNLTNIILIGHSMGGDIILRVQSQVPNRITGFVGVDNFLEVGRILTGEQRKEAESFFSKLEKDFKNESEKFSKTVLFSPKTDTTIVKKVINDIKNSNQAMAVNTLRSLSMEGANERNLFAKMRLKTFLIVSDYNKVNEPSLKKYIKAGYEIRYVQNSGHYPMIEYPAKFNGILREVLLKLKNINSNSLL